MAEAISTLLHLFVDLYEKDPSKLEVLLEDNDCFDLDDLNNLVPRRTQYELLNRADEEAHKELLSKTLLEGSAFEYRHETLRHELGKPKRSTKDDHSYESLPQIKASELAPDEIEMLRNPGLSMDEFRTFIATKHDLTLHEYESRLSQDLARKRLSSKNMAAEVLRFFADRVELIANAIEQLDGTDFTILVPQHLIIPFRELHINAVLGNYGTACILCGTLLERTLQDLLPSDDTLNALIQEAKKHKLLENDNRRYADRIKDDRNKVVHGQLMFSEITSDYAWETVSCTRKLISALYKDRLG